MSIREQDWSEQWCVHETEIYPEKANDPPISAVKKQQYH